MEAIQKIAMRKLQKGGGFPCFIIGLVGLCLIHSFISKKRSQFRNKNYCSLILESAGSITRVGVAYVIGGKAGAYEQVLEEIRPLFMAALFAIMMLIGGLALII